MPTDKLDSLMPSMLFRLIDPDSMQGGQQMGYNVQQMLSAVRSDLEDLFNTRQSVVKVPKDYPEVENSILTYGLQDLTYYNLTNQSECQTVCSMVTKLINRFEPRLRNIRVTLAETEEGDRSARFHIEGQLAVDPAPDVGFDTVVELSSGKTSVQVGGTT